MPIVNIDSNEVLPERAYSGSLIERDLSFIQVMKASWEYNNLLYNIFNRLSYSSNSSEPSYDVFKDLNGYEGYAENFRKIKNSLDTAQVKQAINKEIENKSVLSSSSIKSLPAELITNLADPWFLIITIVLIFVMKTKKWKICIVTLICTVINETLLVMLQYTRNWGEGFITLLFVYSVYGGIVSLLLKLKNTKPDLFSNQPAE